MGINPRKSEIDAVVAVLESEDYESSEDMAKVLLSTVVDELAKRESTYGVGIGLPTDDVVLSFGPYHHLTDAKGVVKEARARGLRAFIAPLLGPTRALRPEDEAVAGKCVCGHPRALHGVAMTTFTGKPKPAPALGCAVYPNRTKCECKGYEKA